MLFSEAHSKMACFVTFLTTIMHFAFPITAECAMSPYKCTTSIFVPYTNADENPNLQQSPTINLGFNGSGNYVPFIMDTGSVGIVASPDIFTPAPGAQNLGPGQQIYSSSGIIEEGTWWSATQEIYDADGALVATANVPVLQVTAIKCSNAARSCRPNNQPKGISVMGIGFARESQEQQRGTPNYNAFLNLQMILRHGKLTKLPKNWCNGYVVCPHGVYLGLTAKNTANAGFVKLLPWATYTTPELSEWMPAPMTLTTNGVSGNGNILMDTGVDAGFLTPPANANLGARVACPGSASADCVASGNVIGIYLPDETNPVASYSFRLGENVNLMQPNGVHLVKGTDIFFNTSRHVLGGINFIYDNANGYIGYIWNGQSSADIGFVKPATFSTTTKLHSLNNPARLGKNVTFSATVNGEHSQIPTGGITFIIDANQQYVPLDNEGKATFSTSQLLKGPHTIVAKYSGDATYIRSTSTDLMQFIWEKRK